METCCKKSAKQKLSFRLLYLLPLRFYQYCISPMLGPHCRFEPSCSHYAEQVMLEHGFLKGSLLTLKRLSRCHPWHKGGYDPAPTSRKTSDLL